MSIVSPRAIYIHAYIYIYICIKKLKCNTRNIHLMKRKAEKKRGGAEKRKQK